MAQPSAQVEGPTRWERRAIWLLLVVIVAFGAVTYHRSVRLHRRMGDLGVFLRAAWAVRQGGEQLYTIPCDAGWHYIYPPLLAILLVPLADPPPGVSQPPWSLPYGASVVVWYVLGILWLFLGVHVLASALERSGAGPRPVWGSRRWWALRVWPVLACIVPLGGTLVRGQVTILLLALLCGYLAASVRGRRLTAGLCLAGAICLKIIPAFLLLVPLGRRDGRCLAGCAVGLVLGLGVLPLIAFGPAQTADCYRNLGVRLLGPALGLGHDKHLSRELIGMTATDSQSILSALHNTAHLKRATRPADASPRVRHTHWLLGGLMTLLTLAAFRRRTGSDESFRTVLLSGALVINMILLSPVCHLHYFALSLPLLMGLVAAEGGRTAHPSWRLRFLIALYLIATILPSVPGLEVLRDLCLAMYGALLVWGYACLAALRRRPVRPLEDSLPLAA
jgi:alpha-1,2-mannosyltransferase